MPSSLPWFAFHNEDWLTDVYVRQMTLAQRGAYITLLAYEWSEGWIPADPEGLRRLLGADKAEWEAIWVEPLVGRFREVDGRLYNPRLEKERIEAIRRHRSLSKRGKDGARVRWDRTQDGHDRTQNGTEVDATVLPEHTMAKSRANGPAIRSEQEEKPQLCGQDSSLEVEDAKAVDATAIASASIGQGTYTVTITDTVDRDNKKSEKGSKIDLETSTSEATGKPAAPRRRWPIWWDKDKGKLDGTEEAKKELLERYVVAGSMSRPEFVEEIGSATYWLADRPHRRGGQSNLQRFLTNWLDKTVKDRRSGDVARERVENSRNRPAPPSAKPSSRWCKVCRETLPTHAEWCPNKGVPDGG